MPDAAAVIDVSLHLCDLVENARDLIQLIGEDGRVLWANRAWRDALGYESLEAVTCNLFEILALDCRDKIRAEIRRVLEGENIGLMPIALLRKDGRRIELEGTCRIHRGEPGGTAVSWSMRGAGAHLPADAIEAKKTERLRALVKKLPGLVAYVTADLRCRIANDEFQQWFGRPVDEANGLDVRDFLGESLFEKNAPFMSRALQGEACQFEREIANNRGEIRQALVQYVPDVPSDRGSIPGFIVLVSDITAIKKAQVAWSENEEALRYSKDRLELAMDAAGMGAWHWDLLKNQRTVDERVSWLLGVDHAATSTPSEEFYKLVHPEDRARIRAAFTKTITTGAPYEVQFRVPLAAGRVRHCASRGRLFRDAAGRPLRIKGITWDITATKETESALRDREAMLSSINANLEGTCLYRVAVHPDGRIEGLYTSPNVETILGISAQRLIADPRAVFEGVHPSDRESFRCAAARAHASGEPLSIVVRTRVKNQVRWMRFRSRATEQRPNGIQVRDGLAVDITEIKSAEIEIDLSARRLNLALHASRSCIWEYHVPKDHLTLDAFWPELVANPSVATTGSVKDFIKLVHPHDRAAILREIAMILHHRKDDYRVEHRVASQGGGWLWIRSHGLVTGRDASNRVTRIVGTNTDITALKAAEAEVRNLNANLERIVRQRTDELQETNTRLTKSEEKFRAVFERSPVMIVLLSVGDGRIADLNAAASSAFGGTRDDVIGRTALELEIWADPAEREEYLRELHLHGYAEAFEARLRRRNGDMFIVLLQGSLVVINGETYILNVLQDITSWRETERALRESESRFRGVFDASPIPKLLTTVPEGRIVEANNAALKIFGYERKEVVGRSTDEIGLWVNPDHRAEYFRRLAEERCIRDFDTTMRTSKGEERFMRCTGTVLMIGNNPFVFSSALDITNVRRAEAERARLQEIVFQTQKSEALGNLAGGIAHDFNNILTGVINYTALAREDCMSRHPQIKGYLDEVLTCCTRAKELVRQIMLFSRAEDGHHEPVLVHLVIKEALALLRSTLPATALIDAHIDTQRATIFGNATQIHQVVMNLVINASQALKGMPGRITVRLSSCVLDAAAIEPLSELKPGPHVRLQVSDTGSGIEEAVLPRIFDPFFTTKPVGEGTGLGLAVVQSIVRSHHGEIKVTSRSGAGTTFEILLPVAPVHSSSQTPESSAIPRGAGQHILLVDDENSIGRSTQLLLTRLGYQITVANRPEEALARFVFMPDSFSAVITDFQMPGMTGLALAKRIWRHRPGTPVVMVSGFTGPLSMPLLQEVGVAALLRKPIDVAELAEVLARIFAVPKDPLQIVQGSSSVKE